LGGGLKILNRKTPGCYAGLLLCPLLYLVITSLAIFSFISKYLTICQGFMSLVFMLIIIIIIIISCHRFSFFPGTSPLEPVVNPTTQASSLSL
jgi:hypothetical protein